MSIEAAPDAGITRDLKGKAIVWADRGFSSGSAECEACGRAASVLEPPRGRPLQSPARTGKMPTASPELLTEFTNATQSRPIRVLELRQRVSCGESCIRAARPRDPDPVRLHQPRGPESRAGRRVHRAGRRCDGGDDQPGGAAAARPARSIRRRPRLAVLHGFRRWRPVERNGHQSRRRYDQWSVVRPHQRSSRRRLVPLFRASAGPLECRRVPAGSVAAARQRVHRGRIFHRCQRRSDSCRTSANIRASCRDRST